MPEGIALLGSRTNPSAKLAIRAVVVYPLRLNPSKCIYVNSSEMFLEFYNE